MAQAAVGAAVTLTCTRRRPPTSRTTKMCTTRYLTLTALQKSQARYRLRVVADEGAPALTGGTSPPSPSAERHVTPHGAGRQPQAELQRELCRNALLAPGRLIRAQPRLGTEGCKPRSSAWVRAISSSGLDISRDAFNRAFGKRSASRGAGRGSVSGTHRTPAGKRSSTSRVLLFTPRQPP